MAINEEGMALVEESIAKAEQEFDTEEAFNKLLAEVRTYMPEEECIEWHVLYEDKYRTFTKKA